MKVLVKRTLALLMTAAVAVSLLVSPVLALPPVEATTYPVGDVDLSGDVDANDLTEMAAHMGRIRMLTTKAHLAPLEGNQRYLLGDLDFSGGVGAVDLTALALHVAGIRRIETEGYGINKADEVGDTLSAEGENGLISYDFTGDNFGKEGFAEGLVNLPTVGQYSLYWTDEYGQRLSGYAAIATGCQEAYAFERNVAIPAGAAGLQVCKDGETTVTDYLDLPGAKMIHEEAYMTFGSLSDVHANYEKGAAKKLTNALNWFDILGMDYVLVSGDLSGDGKVVANYQAYVNACMASTFDYANIIETRGNHDSQDVNNFLYYTATDAAGTRDVREVHPYENSPYFYQLIDGGANRDNLIIALVQELSGISNTYYQDNLSTRQLDWLESVLEEFAGTETNIFLLFHPLVYEYGPGDSDGGGYQEPLICFDKYPNNLRLKSIFTEYREMITMSGHTHIALEYGYNFDDEEGYAPRMIHNPSCYALKDFAGAGQLSDAPSNDNKGSQGYAAYVYPNYVMYCGANLLEREFLPAYCYIMETYSEDRSAATAIEITVAPDKTAYAIGDTFDPKGMEVTATYADGTKAVVKGWTYDLYTTLDADDSKITVLYDDLMATQAISVGGHVYSGFKGNGTKASPYLIEDEEDFYLFTQNMRQYVSTQSSSQTDVYGYGLFFKQTADLDMTGYSEYEGIWADSNRKYGFSGVYDGDGHTLTVSLRKRGYRQCEVSVFPYLNGVVMNLAFAGYIEATLAQPIRTVGSYGLVLNCYSNMELRGNTSNGLAQTVYGTVCRYFCESEIHGTKNAITATNNNGTYYEVFTKVVNGDGNPVTQSYATAVTGASNVVYGDLPAAVITKLKGFDPSYSAADLVPDGTVFHTPNPHAVNIAPLGTAFDNRHTAGAANAFDQDASTSWQYSDIIGEQAVLGVMFAAPQKVNGVSIEWETASRASESGYYIEYTADGTTWQKVPEAHYVYHADVSGHCVDDVDLGPVEVLGLRVVMTEVTNTKYQPKVYDISVWKAE